MVFISYQRLQQLRQGRSSGSHGSSVMSQIKLEKSKADSAEFGLEARRQQVCIYVDVLWRTCQWGAWGAT